MPEAVPVKQRQDGSTTHLLFAEKEGSALIHMSGWSELSPKGGYQPRPKLWLA